MLYNLKTRIVLLMSLPAYRILTTRKGCLDVPKLVSIHRTGPSRDSSHLPSRSKGESTAPHHPLGITLIEFSRVKTGTTRISTIQAPIAPHSYALDLHALAGVALSTWIISIFRSPWLKRDTYPWKSQSVLCVQQYSHMALRQTQSFPDSLSGNDRFRPLSASRPNSSTEETPA